MGNSFCSRRAIQIGQGLVTGRQTDGKSPRYRAEFERAIAIEKAPERSYLHLSLGHALRALKRGKASVVSGWTNFLMVEAERLVPRTLVLRAAGSILRSHTEKG